jgi:choline dehydrogenase
MAGDAADIVIVGAGPAGCVLANRLSADPARRVVLIEAGPDYGPDPAAWPADFNDPDHYGTDLHSWGYLHAGRSPDRHLPLPRARVVGGTSTINACIWLRGSAADYDAWAAAGNPGWTFADLLPAFLRSERDPIGGPLHGASGPVPVSRIAIADLDPLDQAVLETAAAAGSPYVEDLNGDPVQVPCAGQAPKNIGGVLRMHAAFTYLAPARPRANLTITPDTEVDRVLFRGDRAIGVRTVTGHIIDADEVVLCAGAYGSPAILLRSGIGAAIPLREMGIPVVMHLSGVGEHLLDHPLVEAAASGASWPVRPSVALTAGSAIPTIIRTRSRQQGNEPDIHLYVGHYHDPDRATWFFWMSVVLMDARSRGRVRLSSRDPAAPLVIDHAYFSESRDLEAMCDGIELAREIVALQPLAGMLDPGAGPFLQERTRDDLRVWVQEIGSTTFHPSSTCRMGPATDPDAVVDHRGRVHGLEGLRVVDASIFPAGPRANLHCTVVAVAEQLADDLRTDSPA